MLSITNVKVFWADARKDGFHLITDINVPFNAQGCIHVQADVKIAFLRLGTLKLALCFH